MPKYSPIRNDNPCYMCERPWKKPGCHDTCEDRKEWRSEVDRINENRRQYYQWLGCAIRGRK